MIGCRALTDDEVKIIRTEFKSIRDEALFVLNIFTGFRIQESLSLLVRDVYQNDKIVDRVTVGRSNMKGSGASRTVLLHPEAKRVIKALINENDLGPTDYLFKSAKGFNRPITRVQAWRLLNQIVRDKKIEGKVALHSTRKYFASKMYDNLDKNLLKTSKALGHKNIQSTISYLSFRTEEIDEAILSI